MPTIKAVRDSSGKIIGYTARYRDAHGKQPRITRTRKRDVEQALREAENDRARGVSVSPDAAKVTLRAYAEHWATTRHSAENTTTLRAQALASCGFADLALRKITRGHFDRWILAMHEAGLYHSTINTRVQLIRTVVRAAAKAQMIAIDPGAEVTVPARVGVPSADIEVPTPQEVTALIAAAPPELRLFVELSAYAGLRAGELYGLQVGDFPFARPGEARVKVRRQLQNRKGGGYRVEWLKSGHSRRDVPLDPETADLVQRHIHQFRPGTDPERWLFVRRNGEPYHHSTMQKPWERIRAAAGVSTKLHNLRHFYASGLVALGLDLVTVQNNVGHADLTTLRKIYLHVFGDAQDRTRAAVAGIRAQSQAAVVPLVCPDDVDQAR